MQTQSEQIKEKDKLVFCFTTSGDVLRFDYIPKNDQGLWGFRVLPAHYSDEDYLEYLIQGN